MIGLKEYTELINLSPEQLIEEAELEYDTRVKPRKLKIRKHFSDFRGYLETKAIAPLTIENRINAVRSFYKTNFIIIPEVERREYVPLPMEEHKGIPEKEEIRGVLNITDPLEKAIVLVGCSSGLSVNEIINLRVRDFKSGYCQEDQITTLQLRRKKTNYDFVTFLSPEATNAVLDYLSFRDRKVKSKDQTRRDNQLAKQHVYSDDGWLFVSKRIEDSFLISHDEELRKLTDISVLTAFRRLCENKGINAAPGIWNCFRTHNLRKWFSNRLREAKCDPDIRELLMGHKIDGSKANYFVTNPREIKEEYRKCIPFLTIEKSLDISESAAFKQIIGQNETLIIEAEKLRVERQEYTELKAELDALRESLKDKSYVINEFEKMYADPKRRVEAIDTYVGMADESREVVERALQTVEGTEDIKEICLDELEIKIREDALITARKTLDKLL